MNKLSNFIKNNFSNKYIKELMYLKEVWNSILPDMYKNKTSLFNFNNEEKILYVRVYDSLLKDSLTYLENFLLEKLADNGVIYNKINFRYDVMQDSIKYEPIIAEYTINSLCESFIENKVSKISNNILKEGYRKFLISFFKKNNYDEWISKN